MILSDPREESVRIVSAAEERGMRLRLLGGLAVHHRCGDLPPALRRTYNDVDLVVARGDRGAATELLAELGYCPHERFNAINRERLVFYAGDGGGHVDVFVGTFSMCHRIPLAGRLDVDRWTIPLAELLLTKLQVVELNERDLVDLASLLLVHQIRQRDDAGIDGCRVGALCAADWGLWRTVVGNLERVRGLLGRLALGPAAEATIAERLTALEREIEHAPKSLRWRARMRVGDRVRWYDEPEEIAHRHAYR